MIKIYEKKDLKKFCVKKSFAEVLQKIFDTYDYLEFSNGQTFYLGLKDVKNKEIICLDHEQHADFLRKTRDNYKEIISTIKKKNILQKIHSNPLILQQSVYSKILDLKIRTEIQLLSFGNKLQNLSKRLQNVFIVSDSFAKIAKTFDHENLLVIVPNLSDAFNPALKELKHSKIIVFVAEKSVPYKKLKSLGLNNLCTRKGSTKYIWHKNLDINQFDSVEA